MTATECRTAFVFVNPSCSLYFSTLFSYFSKRGGARGYKKEGKSKLSGFN